VRGENGWKRLARYKWLGLFALGIFAFDQLTKLWVVNAIPYGTYLNPRPVIDGFLYWVHIGNRGAAWGMCQGFGSILAIFALITIAGIFLFRRMLALHLVVMQIGFGLLIGGILGNLYDRMTVGHVIDFIDVHLPFYRWPAFNIADSAICVGVFIYVIYSFLPESKVAKSESSGEK